MKKLLIASVGLLLAFSGFAQAGGHMDKEKDGGKFMTMDSDSDGMVSQAEFMKMHEEKFMTLDKDKNGSISNDEFKAHDMMKKDYKSMKHEGMKHEGMMKDKMESM